MKTTTKKGSSSSPLSGETSATKAPKKAKAKRPKKAPATRVAPLAVNRGPAIERPVAPLALRVRITKDLVARIEAEAEKIVTEGPVDLAMAYPVFISEAIKCANMVHTYEESPDPRKYPSLSLFAERMGGPEVAAEILYLTDRADAQRDRAKGTFVANGDSQIVRARFVNRELRLASELDADDGIVDDKDVTLEALQKTHATKPGTLAELADSLGAYARRANEYRDSFGKIPSFDVNLIEEGLLLSDALRSRKANTNRVALASRDTYLLLLRDRITKVRKVVRYAFRATPEVVREATSAFLREKRRAERNPDAREGNEPLPSPSPPEGGEQDDA